MLIKQIDCEISEVSSPFQNQSVRILEVRWLGEVRGIVLEFFEEGSQGVHDFVLVFFV